MVMSCSFLKNGLLGHGFCFPGLGMYLTVRFSVSVLLLAVQGNRSYRGLS